jgi:hypothetical protein
LVVNHTQFRVAAGVRTDPRQPGVGLEFMNVSNRSARLIQDLIIELNNQLKGESANQST